jgi:hypothetical protein
MSDVNYDKVPVDYMRDGVRMYIEEGFMSGHFLTALFSNDLVGVYSRGDKDNTEAMKKWVTFLFNYAPASCWGSKQRVEDWISGGGITGRYKNKELSNDWKD